MTDQLQVHVNPLRAAERVARWRGILRSRLLMAVVAAILAAVVFFWKRAAFNQVGYLILYGFVLVPLVWAIVAAVWGYFAHRELAAVGEGVAMTLDREGITVRDTAVAWRDVKRLGTKNRGPGRSPLLVVEAVDGRTATVMLDYLDVLPSQIDDAARAWTSGRVGLDLSATGV